MLAAAKLGWMLDAMDFMLYAMAIGRLKTYFAFGDATAGMLGTVTLATSAAGGPRSVTAPFRRGTST